AAAVRAGHGEGGLRVPAVDFTVHGDATDIDAALWPAERVGASEHVDAAATHHGDGAGDGRGERLERFERPDNRTAVHRRAVHARLGAAAGPDATEQVQRAAREARVVAVGDRRGGERAGNREVSLAYPGAHQAARLDRGGVHAAIGEESGINAQGLGAAGGEHGDRDPGAGGDRGGRERYADRRA